MAVDEPARSKPNAFFTRYEIVAVAIPGGVFLFGVVLVSGSWEFMLPHGMTLDLTKIELGALGLFTVAAFCLGQVIQALSASFETALHRSTRRVLREMSPRYATKLQRDVLPDFLRDRFADRLANLGVSDPESLSRFEYRNQVFPFILARLYRSGVTDRFLDIRVSWGLHRALALTFLVIAALQPADRYGARALLTLGTLVMIGMTNRYRRQFYDQGTFEYLDLEERSTAWPAK